MTDAVKENRPSSDRLRIRIIIIVFNIIPHYACFTLLQGYYCKGKERKGGSVLCFTLFSFHFHYLHKLLCLYLAFSKLPELLEIRNVSLSLSFFKAMQWLMAQMTRLPLPYPSLFDFWHFYLTVQDWFVSESVRNSLEITYLKGIPSIIFFQNNIISVLLRNIIILLTKINKPPLNPRFKP